MPRSSCSGCGRSFTSLTTFDAHQTEEIRDECCLRDGSTCTRYLSGVICHDPAADPTRFKPSERSSGVWTGAGTAPVDKFTRSEE